MFYLVTGLPGSGKTLSVIHHLKNGVFFGDTTIKRPIYYHNIKGLSDELGWIPLDNPKNFHEHVPVNAILVMDEIQETFPVRSPSSPVPPALAFMEKHRHSALDVYFMTQDARLLDHHARRLINEHWLFKRNFGANFSVWYRKTGVIEDPEDERLLRKADKSNFKFPKESFALYKSAEAHTHKFRIPKKLYLLVPLLLVIFYSLYTLYNTLNYKDKSAQSTALTTPVQTLTNFSAETSKKMVSVDDSRIINIDALIPIIPNVPASAPAYQKQWTPQSAPIISSCIGTKTQCKCYTQQATPVAVTDDFCQSVVLNGLPYDHTLPDSRIQQDKHHAIR